VQIEPDTEIMQTDFGRQAGLKAREVMRATASMLKLEKPELSASSSRAAVRMRARVCSVVA